MIKDLTPHLLETWPIRTVAVRQFIMGDNLSTCFRVHFHGQHLVGSPRCLQIPGHTLALKRCVCYFNKKYYMLISVQTADYVGPIPVNSPSLDKPLNPNRGQIGSYTSDQPSLPYDPEQNQFHKGWLPVPLRTWFSVSLLIVMALGALILEVLWNS